MTMDMNTSRNISKTSIQAKVQTLLFEKKIVIYIFHNFLTDHFGPSPVDFEPIIPQNYQVEQLSHPVPTHHEPEPYLHEEPPSYIEGPAHEIEPSPHPFKPYVHQPHITDDGK